MTIIIVMKSSYSDIENFRFEALALVKAKLSELSNWVSQNDHFLVITKNGKPETALIKFELLKELLRQFPSPRPYFNPSRLKRKKRNPIKEKWLKKWNQLGPYEQN